MPKLTIADLIRQSREAKAARLRAKEQERAEKAKAKTLAKLNGHSSVAIDALVRKIEAEAQWATVARVVLVHHQLCTSCGAEAVYVAGFMARQVHRLDRSASRLIATRYFESPTLPREIIRHRVSTPECAACLDVAEDHGAIEALVHAAGLAEPEQIPLFH